MGRYYSGDIEGKFWFGVQGSNDADFFGSIGCEPNYIEYYFDEDNLEDIKEGLDTCIKELGEWKEKFEKFFKETNGYNNSIIAEHGHDPKEFNRMLEWYARLILGQKILKSVEETGQCNFTAEL